MKEIKAIIQPFMLEHVLDALRAIEGLPGLTMSQVNGWGKSQAQGALGAIHLAGHAFVPKTKLEIVVADEMAGAVVDAIARAARTGKVGDGKIFVYDVADVIQIRTGDHGKGAI